MYFLKRKSEVFVTFKQWKALIKKSIGKKIKHIIIDSDLEFYSGEFDEFYKNKEIVRHHTVKNTP